MIKEMYCHYRNHLYHIGDIIYCDDGSDYDLKQTGNYGKIISFKEFDNCKMVEFEILMDEEGNKPLWNDTCTVYLGNIQPAKEVIQCKVNELLDKINVLKELSGVQNG